MTQTNGDFDKALRGLFRQRAPEPSPFDGQDLIDPRVMRDYLQQPCDKCGLPTVQQYQQVSRARQLPAWWSEDRRASGWQVCTCE